MSRSSTRSLLFGIFVLARRSLTAAQVVALARPLNVTPTNVKSHLTRMVAEGALERSGPRRLATYALAAGQAMVAESIAARLEEAPEERWDGRWLVLSFRMPTSRRSRERLRASLWFDGFRPWTSGTFVRPAWPRVWAEDRARGYLASIPGFGIQGRLVGTMHPQAPASIYRLDDLDKEATRLCRRIREWKNPGSSPAVAFGARLELGGVVANLVGHDPRLPREMLGRRNGLRDLIREFRRFDQRVSAPSERFLDAVLRLPVSKARSPRRRS